jgi:hypothetical protein
MKTIQTLIVMCVLGCQLQAQISFKLSSSPGVGSDPNSVAVADVNGDGKLDLICANYYGNSLSVLTNNGSGGYVTAGTYTVGSLPSVVTAADVNRDGKVDLICANSDGADSTLSVLTNNGSGRFVLAGSYPVGIGPASVTAADVNGDGKVDLISANQGYAQEGHTLTVLTNNGSGGFGLASSPVVGLGSYSVTAVDVNGDGKVDLISADKAAGTLTVLTNNGSGGFVLSGTYPVNGGPAAVTAADVNGDGKVDLISANWGGGGGNTLTVLTNNGSGIFGSNATINVGSGPLVVAAADVNGDGKMDLISANHNANSLTVLTNNGSGGFMLATNLSVAGNPNSVTAVDVNGDGKVDLISPLYPNNVLAVFTNATPFPPSSALLVVPNYLATNDYSFGSGTLREFSRYQEIYGAAEFPTNPIIISQLRFRPNLSGVAPFSTTISSIEVHLSTTRSRPDQLNSTFASNVGANDTIVFQGALTISSQVSGPASGPKDFDIIVPLTTPFVYIPAAGNLLMDIRNYSGSGAGVYLSGSSSGSDDCSRAAAFDPNSPTGWTDTGVDALELVYQPTNLSVAPPVIISQPTNQTVAAGTSLTLVVQASGTEPQTYQWRYGAGAMFGQTNSSLILNPAQTNYTGNYSVVISNPYGIVTSRVAAVFVYLPVSFLAQPLSQTVSYGAPASFGGTASGFPAPTYQWTLNGTNLPGATSDSLTIHHVGLADTGNYQVLVANGYSSSNSYIAMLNMSPSITSPFNGATTIWGREAGISVGAIGSGTLTYQWYFNGHAIDGAVFPQLNFTSIQFTNGGLYSVVVSSLFGSVTNVAAQVIVNPAEVAIGFYAGLTISGAAGNSYIIKSSANLADTNSWVTLTNLTLTEPVQLWVDTNEEVSPFNPMHFYQVLPGQ